MKQQFEVNAYTRTQLGSNANRRIRNSGQIPAIVYGGSQPTALLALDHKELLQHLSHEAFYSHILTLKLDGKDEKVILRDIQRHPSKDRVLHIDFFRVEEDQKIRVHVPLHFINEDVCAGVKQQGGIISHMQTDVEVICLPKDLPEYLEVDVAHLHLGHSLHLSDLKLPNNVEMVALSHREVGDYALVSVVMPRVVETAKQGKTTGETEKHSEAEGV